MQHLGYMAAAYGIIWAAILIYFLGLGRREREIWNELRDLRESIGSGETETETDSGEHQ